MKAVTVTYGQTLQDISLQEYGCFEGISLLYADNNLSVTSQLNTGDVVLVRDVVPELTVSNIAVATYYKQNSVSVNSGLGSSAAGSNGYVTTGYVTTGYVS